MRKKIHTPEYWVYILLCENASYYTGYTTDLIRRYQEHLTGTTKCKYTRSFKPIVIAQSWHLGTDKSLAMRAEKRIKKLRKKQKEYLINFPNELIVYLSL